MEGRVGGHGLALTTGPRMPVRLPDEISERRQARLVEDVDKAVREHDLQGLAHGEQHGDVVGVQAAYDHAAGGALLDEAFPLERAEGLPNRYPGHPELLGDLPFDDASSGREIARDDALAQCLGDGVA